MEFHHAINIIALLFGANLIQTMEKHQKLQGKQPKFKKKRNGKHDNGKQQKKGKSNDSKYAWKTTPPALSKKYGFQNGHPFYKQFINGKKYYWCAKCGDNGGWALLHGTGNHKEGFNKKKSISNSSQGQVNIGEGLVPDA